MFKIAILTIGDEVRIGQVVNTNAAWLSSQLTAVGAFVSEHRTIGDDWEVMLKNINELYTNNDMLITTGGLGPTHDDITKPVLLEYFNDKLIFSEEVYNSLQNYLSNYHRPMTDVVKNQAMIPSTCIPLENKVGTAPGLYFKQNKHNIIALPGVPAEVKYITNTHIIPVVKELIKEHQTEVILYKTYITAGAFESELADKIGNVNEFLGNSSLAFLPNYQGVRLRIGAIAKTEDEARQEIDRISNILTNRIGKYIISEDDLSLSHIVGEKLRQLKKTVAVAESCTGGLLGKEFTEIPGSSDYFLGGIICYSNEAKISLLNIDEQIIKGYGAVSEQTAVAMAANVKQIFQSDYSISITGIAGPGGGTVEKPVGTVWIGISTLIHTYAHLFHFGEIRETNRERAVGMALTLLLEEIKTSI